MGLIAKFLAQAVLLFLRGFFFVFKITFTYFYKCFRELSTAIKDEWKHREIDDEIYG